jgi:hypothetical protein
VKERVSAMNHITDRTDRLKVLQVVRRLILATEAITRLLHIDCDRAKGISAINHRRLILATDAIIDCCDHEKGFFGRDSYEG